MVHVSFSLRKALFATTASVLALAAATPAVAQEATTDSNQKPKVTPDQIQGPVGPAQVRTGTEAKPGDIVITGLRASIQASLDRKRRSDIVSEVVTAQDIGKFPDKNVADSLGRLQINLRMGLAMRDIFRGEDRRESRLIAEYI